MSVELNGPPYSIDEAIDWSSVGIFTLPGLAGHIPPVGRVASEKDESTVAIFSNNGSSWTRRTQIGRLRRRVRKEKGFSGFNK
ncbi:hypothetical protein XPA_003800 [Xanthoria parietina]